MLLITQDTHHDNNLSMILIVMQMNLSITCSYREYPAKHGTSFIAEMCHAKDAPYDTHATHTFNDSSTMGKKKITHAPYDTHTITR